LVDHLLQKAQTKLQRQIHGISAEAMRWIRAYSWPGNVRELANMLERAVALTEHDTILLEDLAQATQLSIDDNLLNNGRVEMWRGSIRFGLSVSVSFV